MDHYKTLGIPRNADADSIRKAYRRMALKNHPDKGGDPEVFKAISEANSVLSDPEKKKLYDTYGEDFEKVSGPGGPGGFGGHGQGHGPGFSMGDMGEVFGSFFGGMSGMPGIHMNFRGANHPRQPTQTKHNITLPLNDFYTGKTVKRVVSRLEKCGKCDGKGGEKIHENNCVPCSGQGFRVSQQGGGGLSSIFQTRVKCQSCEGAGKSKRIENPCSNCSATGRVSERVIIEPTLKPGDKPGTRCVFPGMGNYVPNSTSPTGDIVITINPEANEFKRKGNDLYIEREISLKQCLTGFSLDVKHLDGRIVKVTVPKGQVTPPGTSTRILKEGIPRNTGSLVVTFSVNFPKRLDEKAIEKISEAL